MFCEEKCYNILISRRLIFTEEEQDQYQEENKRKIVIEITEPHLYPSCFKMGGHILRANPSHSSTPKYVG